MEQVLNGVVSEVAHTDRLARLGCDILEFIFTKVGTKLVVRGDHEEDEHDLASDLIAVTTLFVASYNGRRSAENRKRRRQEKEGNGESKRKKGGKKGKIGPPKHETSKGEEEL